MGKIIKKSSLCLTKELLSKAVIFALLMFVAANSNHLKGTPIDYMLTGMMFYFFVGIFENVGLIAYRHIRRFN